MDTINLWQKEVECQICGSRERIELEVGGVVRPNVEALIRQDFPQWDETGWICIDDLHKYQHKYVQSLLATEKEELTELELEVLHNMEEHEILAQNPIEEIDLDRTFGERLADQIATFGGSWSFIISFAIILISWMFINSYILASNPFDPFPFILLNLLLSTLAAIQAPLIMMSQNRQEQKDRLRALNDYQINLKAELEIRQLHQKMDHLLSSQWERLIEIQQIQMELINEIRTKQN